MTFTRLQREAIRRIGKQLNLELAIAYGSRVKGTGRPDSDLDLAVQTPFHPTYEQFKLIFEAFSSVFPHTNLDVRFLNRSDPLYSFQVARDGRLLFGDTKTYSRFLETANRRYIDDGMTYFPALDQHLAMQQRRLKGTS